MSRILIVDDDPHIRELAMAFLRHDGFDVYEAPDGIEALATIETIKVDLVILDVMMPKLDGWELCRRLREQNDTPVLILTARGDTADRIKGFQLGSDDYLVKPFEPLELVARVKALLRRYRIATSQTVQLGELRMDRKSCEVSVHGEPMTIPLKEYELLSHEIQSPLTSIRGFAQALEEDNLPIEARRHYLTIIETESTRLSRLTDNLQRSASLEAKQGRFEPKLY